MRLIFLFSLAILSDVALAQQTSNETSPFSNLSQCTVPTPRIDSQSLPQVTLDNAEQIHVSADHAQLNFPSLASYRGNVNFRLGETYIRADRATYSELDDLFEASGNLHYQDQALTLTSESLRTSLNGENTELLNNKYWFNGTLIHGKAESFKVSQGRYLTLTDAKFTTCPDPEPDWALHADEILIDSEEAWATIRRATFKIFDVPVFYFPYLTLPISDKRSSGFLYPNIGSSTKNGVDVSIPFYWNIAPEYDLTLTPRIMSKRGSQLQTEFRYLAGQQQGLLNFDYLHQDSSFNDKSRYFLHWNHVGQISDNWRIATDITHVSDDNYLNDIGTKLANKNDNQLVKNVEVAYYQKDWWLNIKLQDIQVLGAPKTPYKLLPQISFHSYQNNISPYLEADLFSELSVFASDDYKNDSAVRLHIEPTLRMPINFSAGSLQGEFKLMHTMYQQSDANEQNKSISRTLPQLRITGNVNFEREVKFFGEGLLQTLEPQIQYLYVPYKDQSEINLYDTALLRDDYAGLFRARGFSGLDRILDANQLTIGMTTRIKDMNNKESLKLSIGQTYYFKQSQLTLDSNNTTQDAMQRFNSSALAGEIDFNFNNQWHFSQALQLDDNHTKINQSKLTVDYRISDSKLVQFSHRFIKDINNSKINQLGLKMVWPIDEKWTVVGNFYRDLNLNRTIDRFIGLQYESCCWAIQFKAYRELRTHYQVGSTMSALVQNEFDSGFSLSFQIRGLGATKKSKAAEMLSDGLFSYRRPYYLKN